MNEDNRASSAKLRRPAVFFRSLHTMVTAGLPIHESLHFLAESSDGENDRAICHELAIALSRGQRLSVGLARFPRAFNRYEVGLIAVAETTGALSQVLKIISEQLERSQALNQKLKSALVYPLVLVVGSLALLVIAPAWLLEGHFTMLRDSGQPLPWLTRLLIAWSEFCRSPFLLAVLLLLIGLVIWGYSHKKVRTRLRRFTGLLPGLRDILQLVTTTRFARSLCLALRAGMTAFQAVPVCIRATGDTLLIERTEPIMASLEAGETLPDALGNARFFPMTFGSVLVAGDESGKTTNILDMMANLYEIEITSAVEQLTHLIEPVLLLMVGIFVGLVLVATMQPTISLLEAL